MPGLLEGLKRRPRGTFCFYGPPGTGKTALARHLAEMLDRPLLARRASDLLSMWVGETEKNIAAMFEQARDEDAVLILDEADSFLVDRRDAVRNWEVTQVNELLTQMEEFEGIFICTTNLMETLDPASLRRFTWKVRFEYLLPEQRWRLFVQELERLGGALPEDAEPLACRIRQLSTLTPGDFATVTRQQAILGGSPAGETFLHALEEECRAKGERMTTIGFVHH